MSMRYEIENLISNINVASVICKPILVNSKNIAKMISAFSNTNGGGYIIFGAELDSEKINILGLSREFYVDSIIDKAINLLETKTEIEYEFMNINNNNILAIKVSKSKEIILFQNNKYIIENNEITKCKGEIILDKTKVFIVHGHDNLAKEETARFIEKLGFEAIVLHEQASGGDTIIEKIERYSNVGFGIVLYTPCDLGKNKDGVELKKRARQNVIFEHGYLIGKIGRKNVCALVKDEIEKPNDIAGVVYIDMDTSGSWKSKLILEMKNSGYNIDANLLYK
ncbi:putative nucleotide-binding protein containing TIR-like domain protein [Clostridium butyricum]|uniref:Putative nucleotide-binding protein containing TIR-like domain protein n=2 Tax=Clostridium butyricum TaxID=1492 RepID=A0A6N2ZRH8_CLOBU